MFPPTPPPDSEHNRPSLQTAQTFTTAQTFATVPRSLGTTRANSVRNTPVQQVAEDPVSPKSVQEKPRLGTSRTASEPRGPSSKYSNPRSPKDHRDPREQHSRRERLFRETTPSIRDAEGHDDADIDEYPDELYDLYSNTARSNPYSGGQKRGTSRTRRRSRSRQRGDFIDEDEEVTSPSVHSSLEDFEILNNAGGTLSRPVREESRVRGSSRVRRQNDVRTIRVKVHGGDDTRYLMVSTTIMYEEFLTRVREKLALQTGFKVKIKDEGDLITMGDRDDWELAVQTARRDARNDTADMGKMEVR